MQDGSAASRDPKRWTF